MSSRVQIIAFYLPQFHPIPENDAWWGTGFTEWTNTRRATPLFQGQYQPREPVEEGYYSLLEPKVRAWQADLARTYGLDAFCYHHYWFKGRRLLERPVEQVLSSGQPDFPFCLSWANEAWSRSWNGRSRDILIPQSYGTLPDWVEHFQYLLAFWKDRRYVTVDGKPLFVIYRPSTIPKLDQMLACWRRLARENGLAGLHLVQALNTFESRPRTGFDAHLLVEPMYTLTHGMPLGWTIRRYGRGALCAISTSSGRPGNGFMDRIDYDQIWQRILTRPSPNVPGARVYPGAFVDWDNSPRRGPRGTMFEGASPQKFERYLAALAERAHSGYKSNLVFLNAWNEWAEGAYLEPDRRFGRAYLEAVLNVRKMSS